MKIYALCFLNFVFMFVSCFSRQDCSERIEDFRKKPFELIVLQKPRFNGRTYAVKVARLDGGIYFLKGGDVDFSRSLHDVKINDTLVLSDDYSVREKMIRKDKWLQIYFEVHSKDSVREVLYYECKCERFNLPN